MKIAARTDKGKLRKLNEDLYYVDEKSNLLVIVDGVGGHNAGDVASQIAVAVFHEWVEGMICQQPADFDVSPDEKLRILKQLAIEANRRIYDYSQQNSLSDGMGTTLIAGFLMPSHLVYVHVGDSRIYVLRDGVIQQITKDHSLVQEMVDRDVLTLQEARIHPQRNIISRAVGLESTVEIDCGMHPVHSEDVILVCTDGLHDMITDDTEIANLIASAPDLDAASRGLIDKALDYGGEDNVTLILATFS
ncbi:Stp1/IreP family PP2C-type Ser/Thr phosphatase [Candidatus Poribacteria bacterium]|nr:Stp1/IreP family PP2C-type Ser/Thr phosphatase [Candidatus Poribacteria bacterium]